MNYSKVDLTVVIPLYNKKATIRFAVESVLSQLGELDFLIVVDDGSTDGSAEELNCFNDHRLLVLHQKNAGVSAARNRGVSAAVTEYIAFLDADDFWSPSVVAQFKYMAGQGENCVLFSVGTLRKESLNYEELRKIKAQPAQGGRVLNGAEFIRLYAYKDVVHSSAVCVKKSAITEIGGFPDGALSGEDIYVWLNLALIGKSMVLDQKLVFVLRGAPSERAPRDPIPYYMKWICNVIDEKKYTDYERNSLKIFLAKRGLNSCMGQVMAGRKRIAYRRIKKIVRINPLLAPIGILVLCTPRAVLKAMFNVKRLAKSA